MQQPEHCRDYNPAGSGTRVVKNPVVDEILTEKWNEDLQNYCDFVDI